jgi:acyl carrier protein
MGNGETVEETLKRIVIRITRKKDVILSDDTTMSELGTDSLDRVQILIALEDEYGIELGEQEVATLPNIGSFVRLLKQKIADKEAAIR